MESFYGCPRKRQIILFADDDEDDRLLVKEAFASAEVPPSDLYFAENGQDLLDYLRHHGKYAVRNIPSPRPDLILLDLNMPKKDGRESLREIKSDPELCCIPIIILTTSKEAEDITRCYELGASTFICKPKSYSELERIAENLCRYWMRVAALPKQKQLRGRYAEH